MIAKFCREITVIVHDVPVKIIMVFGSVVRFPEIHKPEGKTNGKNKKNNCRFFKVLLAEQTIEFIELH
ncbi:MAG: hypothetical protein KGZ74_10655 [Chitinophagaceae bacterium]|nr:hypothetical protein [Chitinophagaceae bacterium]